MWLYVIRIGGVNSFNYSCHKNRMPSKGQSDGR